MSAQQSLTKLHLDIAVSKTYIASEVKDMKIGEITQDLTSEGYIASVQCAEVWCPMPEAFMTHYVRHEGSQKRYNCADCAHITFEIRPTLKDTLSLPCFVTAFLSASMVREPLLQAAILCNESLQIPILPISTPVS